MQSIFAIEFGNSLPGTLCFFGTINTIPPHFSDSINRDRTVSHVGLCNMSDSNGQPHVTAVDVVAVFEIEIDKAARSFVFAAQEGRTESHDKPQYLRISFDRYSRTLEDLLLVTRLLRRCLPSSPADSDECKSFETEAAQTLQLVKETLCISDNRLTDEGMKADAPKCKILQSQAAATFLELVTKLQTLSARHQPIS